MEFKKTDSPVTFQTSRFTAIRASQFRFTRLIKKERVIYRDKEEEIDKNNPIHHYCNTSLL